MLVDPKCMEDLSELEWYEDSNPLPGELLSTLVVGKTDRSTIPSISFRFVSNAKRDSLGGGGGGET